MTTTPRHTAIIVRSALAAAVCLVGSIGFPFWYSLLVGTLPTPIQHTLTQFLPLDVLSDWWLQIAIVGGAIWGWWLAHLLAYPHIWRLVVAGGAGVGIGMVLATGPIQRFVFDSPLILLERTPLYVRFALEFVLGISVVVTMAGVALGVAIQSWRAAISLALAGSFAATIAAGGVLIIMDLLGLRVGTGNAAIAKVTVLGFLAAGLAGGALFGWVLARHVAPIHPDSP